jgi:hypothetical protein
MAKSDATKTDDPMKKKQVLNHIAQVESLLPTDLTAANDLMNKPTDLQGNCSKRNEEIRN